MAFLNMAHKYPKFALEISSKQSYTVMCQNMLSLRVNGGVKVCGCCEGMRRLLKSRKGNYFKNVKDQAMVLCA